MFSTQPHDYSQCDHANGICTDANQYTPEEVTGLLEHAKRMREAHESFMAQFAN